MPKLLTEPQLAVLRWIADGRPKGVYEDDFLHRITARALERRGLVKVAGRGTSWRATITPGGRYYAEHLRYEDVDQPPRANVPIDHGTPPRQDRPAVTPVQIDDLLIRLREAGGVLRIDAPSAVDRVSYQQAVAEVRASSELADGERIKMKGIKHGPITIELSQLSDEVDPTIAVMAEPDYGDPVVRAAEAKLTEVSDSAKPRALAVVQAIAQECTARAWTITFDEEAGFEISIREDRYRCRLFEEKERRDVYPEEDLAQRKHDWQRVSPTRMNVHTGRLRLILAAGYPERWWADRQRWTLVSKLPEFIAVLDEMSTAARERRVKLEQAHRANLELWTTSVSRAHELHFQAFNAQRAQEQIASWRQALDLRAYADEIEARGERDSTSDDPPSSQWTSWLRTEADRIDPLLHASTLRIETPEDVSVAALDTYMPKGWTTRYPPAPPTWLPS